MLQNNKRAASDHFLRLMSGHLDCNWTRLRQALLTQHSEVGDTVLAQDIPAAREEQRATRQFEMRRGKEPVDVEAAKTAASVKIENAINDHCARLGKAVVTPQVPTRSREKPTTMTLLDA